MDNGVPEDFMPASAFHVDQPFPLTVDGKPFLILGGELGNSASSHPGSMDPVWKKLAELGLNTVLTPVSWELWEPQEGRFAPALLEGLLEGARAHGLRLALLWFGTWKNSMSCYVPSWVKRDPDRFPRARTRDGRAQDILSAFSKETREADARAFAALMDHLARVDRQGTVILVQVENEIGMLPEARESGALADALFAGPVPSELLKDLDQNATRLEPELLTAWGRLGRRASGTWTEVFGPGIATEELFMAWHYAQFVEAVTAAGKAKHPVPMFVNAALNRVHQRPGEYPSAGPLPHLIDVWKAGAPSIDLISPDLYWGDFELWCQRYDRPDNPLFIPECGKGTINSAQAFLALGRHGALGFCPFSIDTFEGQEANDLRRGYALIRAATPVLVTHRGRTAGALLTKERRVTSFQLGGYTMTVKHDHTLGWSPGAGDEVWQAGGCIVIELGNEEFLVLGSGVVLTFGVPGEALASAGIDTVEQGHYDNGIWTETRRLNGDETHQGRHVRIPVGQWDTQKFRLFTYR